MHYCNEILLCTSCHHVLSSKAALSGFAYSHPVLEVLICKRCYNRLSNTTSVSDKLCVWCGFPGKYTTCIKCSSNFCIKCLRKNFKEDIFNNILKEKNWTCFCCLPALLSEHKARCAKALGTQEPENSMGNVQSPAVSRKRSNSETHAKPSKRHERCNSYYVSSSDDEMPMHEYTCETNKNVPSLKNYASAKKEIIEKANQLSMLFFEVNQRALKFKHKLENQSCNLKVLQNAFTFKNDLLDTTINTLKIWKEELANMGNKWEQDFDISLVVPGTAESRERDVDGVEELDNSNEEYSRAKEKRKKFRLSLKRTFESENTDDGISENIKDCSMIPAVNSTLNDEEIMSLEREEGENPDNSEVPSGVHGAEQNEVTVILETVVPELRNTDGGDDSDHESIFSEKTVVLNFDELQPTLSEDQINIKNEVCSSNEEFTNTQINSDTMKLCETSGYFITASFESDLSQNINLSDCIGAGDDAGSENSFIFDLNGCSSYVPPDIETDDSDATVCYDVGLNIDGVINTPIPVGDTEEIYQSQCDAEIKSKTNEIAASNETLQNNSNPIVDSNDVQNELENHVNNKVADVPEPDEAAKEHSDNEHPDIDGNESGSKCNNKVTDEHEPEPDVAQNEQNNKNKDQQEVIGTENGSEQNNEIKDNHDPCCSRNEDKIEHEVDNDNKEIEDIALETSFKVDIKSMLPTEDELSDPEDDKDKIDFLEQLQLFAINSDKIKKEEAHNTEEVAKANKSCSKNIRDALKLLQEDDSDLFDSDIDSSVSSVSDDTEEENVKINDKPDLLGKKDDQLGLISVTFPALPEETVDDAETIPSDDDGNNKNDRENTEFQIIPCSVILERVKDTFLNNPKASTSNDSELKAIDRLTNLNNLDLKRKDNKPPKKGKLKRRKITKPSGSSGSESQMNDSDSDGDLLRSPSPLSPHPAMSDISCEGMLDALINLAEPTSDFDMDTSDKESDSDDGEKKKKKKKKKRDVSADSNKENQPDNQENDKNKELTAEELALAEKRKWRNDPLLRTKFSESENETDSDGTVEGENILSEKTKKKMEQLEKRMLNRDITQKVIKQHSNSTKTENESDKDVSLSSEIDDDIDDIKPSIIINTDTDSDIEFISDSKKRTPTKSPKPKSSICISSEDEAKQSEEDEESGNKKKGRKNIRAILSDETLEEETKRANLIERQRKERLSQKHKNMDNILSQSQILSQEEGLILDVDEETESPLIVVNSHLTKRLKNHQQAGVRFMWESCYEGVKQLKKDAGSGCILAHCMGLGKTFQVVTLIHTLFAHSITNTKHVLVVCPLSIVLNWKNEFQQGLDGLRDNVNINIFCISERDSGVRARLFVVDKWRSETGVLILGYEAYQRLTNFKGSKNTKRDENIKKALVDPGPNLVVLDEGHLMKNGKNCRTKALMKVKTKRRIILTGTPLQNNLKEYYYMVQFVKPNLLGSYVEYTNRFVNPITNGQFHDSTEDDIRRMKKRSHVLHKLLRATIQRYEVTELQSYLPGKFDYVLFIQPHLVQAKLYQKYIDNLKNEAGVIKGSIINHYHQLHILWTHPCLLHLRQEQKKSQKKSKEMDTINLDPEINDADEFPDGWWHSLCPDDYKANIDYGPKLKVMLSIIQECEKIGDKVLIFSSSIVELDAIEFFLKQHATPTSQWTPKLDYYRMDGSVMPDVRLQLCNSFNDEKNNRVRVFLISNRVGGLGLNLVAANRVIVMDVNWNPAYDSQSVFRIYRFGQKKQCYIYRLVSMGTMEEVVYQRQINKLATAGRVVDEMQISRHYKSDDLQKMYSLNFNKDLERPPLGVPSDVVLATILQVREEIFKYHEHQSLLENKPEEELDEDEMKLAWEEFNKENENRNKQIEDQKKKMMAPQPGPSGVNNFLPGLTAQQYVKQLFKNNPNATIVPVQGSNVPVVVPYRAVNRTKTKGDTAQQEPQFEVVLVADNNRQAFSAEEASEFQTNRGQQHNVAKANKPNELRSKFYDYVGQFFPHPETSSVVRKLVTPQLETSLVPTTIQALPQNNKGGGMRKLVTPQKPESSYIPTTIQAQPQNNDIVMPQIVNSYTELQRTTTANITNTNSVSAMPKSANARPYKSTNKTAPLPKNVIRKAVAAYAVPQSSMNRNVVNGSAGKKKPNNVQITRKTSFVNTSAEVQSSINANNTFSISAVIPKNIGINTPKKGIDLKKVGQKMQTTQPSIKTNNPTIINAPALPKNIINNKLTAVNLYDVVQNIKSTKSSIEPQPSKSTRHKTNSNDATALPIKKVADICDEIIDLDYEMAFNAAEQQEIIKSLNENLDITLSKCEKSQQNGGSSGSLKTSVNGGQNQISISTVRRNSMKLSPDDVIEID